MKGAGPISLLQYGWSRGGSMIRVGACPPLGLGRVELLGKWPTFP